MYESGIKYTRTPQERVDEELSWKRPDTAFFAAGACHILAFTFQDMFPDLNIQIKHIMPAARFNGAGSHVYALEGEWAFDFNGWSKESELLAATEEAYRAAHPGWEYELVTFTDDLEASCEKYSHRKPEDFAHLPFERAEAFIRQFDSRPPQR